MMEEFQAAAAAVTASATWRAAAGHAGPIWSFDNDRIHQNTLTLASLKINSKNRFPLPANSPDMHRVVERSIARLKGAFADWMYDHPAPRSAATYQAALRRLFKSTQTAQVVQADVAKLPNLWPTIIKNKGGWATTDQL